VNIFDQKKTNIKVNSDFFFLVCGLYFKSVDEYKYLKASMSNCPVQTSRYSSKEYYFPQSSNRKDIYLSILLTCEYILLVLTIRQKIVSWVSVMPHGIQWQASLKCNYFYRNITLSHFVLLTNRPGSPQRSGDGILFSQACASL
jgi:hypothetical protein